MSSEEWLDASEIQLLKDSLERRRQELQREMENAESELQRIKLGESIAAFLNDNEEMKAAMATLNLDPMGQPFVLNVTWNGKNKRFTLGPSPESSYEPLAPRSTQAVTSATNSPVKRKVARPFGQRPPQEEDYFIPILKALKHFEWSATPEQITPLVLESMRPRLTENDFERIPSGMYIRWECRMRFARKHMKDRNPPYLNPNSPRGLWEATDHGRHHLDEME